MRQLNLNGIYLDVSTSKLEEVPKRPLPHIAILGRSNVGKSSLLTHLARRRQLAKVSKTAGKTRRLDFYMVPDQFFLVDLPGYGYARVGSSLKVKWSELIAGYLEMPAVTGAIILVDGRHDPSSDDMQMLEWIRSHDLKAIVVLTKCDKLKKNEREGRFAKTADLLGLKPADLITYDIYSNHGRERLCRVIEDLIWA